MSTSGAGLAADYDALAPYYDAFTADSDYETLTRHLLELLVEHGFAGRTLLDLACGTGRSFEPFLERGFEVTGCDLSAGMLAEASDRFPQASLLQLDIRNLPRLGSFDLVTCLDDSLNNLLEPHELEAAFRGIARNLAPAGLAAFDLNSLLAYRTTFASDRLIEREGIVFGWHGLGTPDAGEGCLAEALLEAFVPCRENLYERVESRHRQRHFGREEVLDLLAAARLECVAARGLRRDAGLAASADESRHLKVVYAARPARGGDS